MIYITGDCHADFSKFDIENFPEQKEMTKDDYVIICGDFGGVWVRDEESEKEKYLMDWLENKSFTTLFVDGNHENFDRLYSYPVEEWNGGKIHKIRPSVIHLMRGQVYTIEGKKIFTFGGARSHDINGGILEYNAPDFHKKRKELERNYKSYRVNHYSWWKQEMPSEEEMEEGIRNLGLHDNKVDFIVTHCTHSSMQACIGDGMYHPDALTKYFEKIARNINYEKWFFGHYHDNRFLAGGKSMLLYEDIIRVT